MSLITRLNLNSFTMMTGIFSLITLGHVHDGTHTSGDMSILVEIKKIGFEGSGTFTMPS
jgi:hypothetical protein